jgi:hypothetical protein
MVRPGALARVIIAIIFIASGVIYAQVKPNQLLVFIAGVDGSGAPITDLKPEEVAMTENGVPGKVVSVDRHSLPIKLTIAVDNGKDSQLAMAALREGLTGLVQALPADVEVTVVTMVQPQTIVRPTTDRGQITKGITSIAPETRAVSKFSETLVEYADRVDKDFKDKKPLYTPMLLMVSTPTPELENVQPDTINKAMNTLLSRGARASVIMVLATTQNVVGATADLKQGRQALIGQQLVKASRGKFEALTQFSRLSTLLPEWGKEIAASHTKQSNQFRVVIDRPNGNTGQLNQPGLQITRPGANGAVSPDGRFD